MDKPDMTGVPTTDRGTWMQLANGRVFYPMDPRPEEVFIEDIAQSLSRQIRYNGMSDKPISVAQHVCQCAWLADVQEQPNTVQLALLMHDAAEAYIGDMIRPLKVYFPAFIEIENSIMIVINKRFDLPTISDELLSYYDNLALGWEKRDMYESASPWPGMPELENWLPTMETWTTEYSYTRFLSLFEWLRLD